MASNPQTVSQFMKRPKSLTAMAFDSMLHAIEEAEFPYNTMLSENYISSLYGISKTPVREAFVSLRALGLIEIMPQRGCLVHMPSLEEVRELCEVRFELECAGIRLSHQRDWQRLLDAAEPIVATMRAGKNDLDIRDYNRLDDSFHKVFFIGCGCPSSDDLAQLGSRISGVSASSLG